MKEAKDTRRDGNPRAFVGVGVSFMGAGIALASALSDSSGPAVGISLFALGLVFLLSGLARQRKLASGGGSDGGDERPPA